MALLACVFTPKGPRGLQMMIVEMRRLATLSSLGS